MENGKMKIKDVNIMFMLNSVSAMRCYIESYYNLIINAWYQHIDNDDEIDLEDLKLELMDAYEDIETRINEYDGVEYNKYFILCNALNDEFNADADFKISKYYYLEKGGLCNCENE